MNVRNCRKCGRIFNYVMGPIVCPRCKEEQENKFQEVKKYVQDNRGADIHEVATECDVDPSQIRQWIREVCRRFTHKAPLRKLRRHDSVRAFLREMQIGSYKRVKTCSRKG